MKIIAYTPLHYGVEYLAYAIRSVIDYIDEYYVLYTAHGSYGFRTDIPCPDTREALAAIAIEAAGDKLRWIDGEWGNESDHRNHIHTVAPDADVILPIDSDEIFAPELVKGLVTTFSDPRQWLYRRYRLGFIHYWRSFHKAVLHDGQFPVRLILPNVNADTEGQLETVAKINHMGYAQSPAITEYKWRIHGHKNELRPEWFNDVFMTNRQTDCHPVSIGLWNPVAVDYRQYMPTWMSDHPYAEMDVIK